MIHVSRDESRNESARPPPHLGNRVRPSERRRGPPPGRRRPPGVAGGAGGGRRVPAPAPGAAPAGRQRRGCGGHDRRAGRDLPLRPAGAPLRPLDHPRPVAVGVALPPGGQSPHAGALPGLVRAPRPAAHRPGPAGVRRPGDRLGASPPEPPHGPGAGARRAPPAAPDDRPHRSGGRPPLVGGAGDRPVRRPDGRRRRALASPRRPAEQDRRPGHPAAPGVRHHRRLRPGDARPPRARPRPLHRPADGRGGRGGAPGGHRAGHRRPGRAGRAALPAGRPHRAEPPRPERAGGAAVGPALRLQGLPHQRRRIHDGGRPGGDQAGVADRRRDAGHGAPPAPGPAPAGAGGGEHPLRRRGRRRPRRPGPPRGRWTCCRASSYAPRCPGRPRRRAPERTGDERR
jgi:translation initiation factor IF-2